MKTHACNCCGIVLPVSDFYLKGYNKEGKPLYNWRCKPCRTADYAKYNEARKAKSPGTRMKPRQPREPKEFTDADEERLFSAKRGAVSMRISAELANEAFPLLSNQYWKAGEAQKIYKQFGMKWSYV